MLCIFAVLFFLLCASAPLRFISYCQLPDLDSFAVGGDALAMAAVETLRHQLRNSIYVLLGFAAVSTVGFMVFGYPQRTLLEALHITANIFSTVGAWKEELNDAEQVWEILMIVFGIGAAAYALGSVTALLTSGEMRRTLGRRQLVDKIASQSGHYIVCGMGRMGASICRELREDRVPFVVIDNADAKTTRADELGYLYILGDAADEQMLQQAGIERAKGLVTCLPHDADNVFVSLTARGLRQDLLIVARAEKEETEPRLRRAGADRVICPSVSGALRVTRMLLHPAMEDILDATLSRDLAVDRVSIDRLGDATGKTLRELALPKRYGVMVLGVTNAAGKRTFNPPADHMLRKGDELIVIGPSGAAEKICEDFTP